MTAGHQTPRLTAEEFADEFQSAGRVLWTVAAGVLGERSEAEDVLQEACLMALGKLDRFERGTSFVAWMGRFVRFVALNQVRKRDRRGTRPVPPEDLAGLGEADSGATRPETGPGRIPIDVCGELGEDTGHFDDRVLHGLRGLTAIQRACLLLRTVLDQSYREIAATLEIPEGTAMSHVHRARTSLRERLLGEALEMEKPA